MEVAARLFESYDLNQNGVLKLAEFASLMQALSSSSVEDLFRRADKEGKGAIDFGAFLQMQRKRRRLKGLFRASGALLADLKRTKAQREDKETSSPGAAPKSGSSSPDRRSSDRRSSSGGGASSDHASPERESSLTAKRRLAERSSPSPRGNPSSPPLRPSTSPPLRPSAPLSSRSPPSAAADEVPRRRDKTASKSKPTADGARSVRGSGGTGADSPVGRRPPSAASGGSLSPTKRSSSRSSVGDLTAAPANGTSVAPAGSPGFRRPKSKPEPAGSGGGSGSGVGGVA